MHIDHLRQPLYASVYNLIVLSQQVDLSTLRVVYFANFHSHLSYAIMIWGNSSSACDLFDLQKMAIGRTDSLIGVSYRFESLSVRNIFRCLTLLHNLYYIYIISVPFWIIMTKWTLPSTYAYSNSYTKNCKLYVYQIGHVFLKIFNSTNFWII